MAKGDRTLEIANMKDGKTVTTAKVELAKDGKSRTLDTDGTTGGRQEGPRQVRVRQAVVGLWSAEYRNH